MYQFHIADDHPLFRTALLGVIVKFFPDATTTQSSDLETTLQQLQNNADIDLLLLDLNMPGSQDLFGLVAVRDKFPNIPVAVVSAREDLETISRAIAHGACGYIPKSMLPQDIYTTIKGLLAGEVWVPPSCRDRLIRVSKEEYSLAAKIASLTPQQYRVLCHLREGYLNKQIGYKMDVTEATVKAHITSIFRKLGVNNRTQAVIMLSHMTLDTRNDSL